MFSRFRTRRLWAISLAAIPCVLKCFLWIYSIFLYVPPVNGTGWEELGAVIVAAMCSMPLSVAMIISIGLSISIMASKRASDSDRKIAIASAAIAVFGIASSAYIYVTACFLDGIFGLPVF